MNSTRYRILALFYTPRVVLHPSQIVRKLVDIRADAVRKMLQRMTKDGQLYHLRQGQYARSKTATPIDYRRPSGSMIEARLRELESRVMELERKTGTLI